MFQTEMLDSKGIVDVNKTYPSLLQPASDGFERTCLRCAYRRDRCIACRKIEQHRHDLFPRCVPRNRSIKTRMKNWVQIGQAGCAGIIDTGDRAVACARRKLMGEGKRAEPVHPGIYRLRYRRVSLLMFILGFSGRRPVPTPHSLRSSAVSCYRCSSNSCRGLVDLSFLADSGFSKSEQGRCVWILPSTAWDLYSCSV